MIEDDIQRNTTLAYRAPEEIDLQKNFGFEKASNDWILSIDVDEEVSKELAEEIKTLIKGNVKENGFKKWNFLKMS